MSWRPTSVCRERKPKRNHSQEFHGICVLTIFQNSHEITSNRAFFVKVESLSLDLEKSHNAKTSSVLAYGHIGDSSFYF